jgi:glutamine synthetase
MKMKSQKEMDREILSSVKKEMARPRLAASVRDALDALDAAAARTARALAIRPMKA